MLISHLDTFSHSSTIHCGINCETISVSIMNSFLYQFRIHFWNHCRLILDQFEPDLESVWDAFCIDLAFILDIHFGDVLDSVWAPFRTPFGIYFEAIASAATLHSGHGRGKFGEVEQG